MVLGILVVPGLGIFPGKNFQDFRNRALFRKKMGIQDLNFQSGSRECFALWNAWIWNYSRKNFLGIQNWTPPIPPPSTSSSRVSEIQNSYQDFRCFHSLFQWLHNHFEASTVVADTLLGIATVKQNFDVTL